MDKNWCTSLASLGPNVFIANTHTHTYIYAHVFIFKTSQCTKGSITTAI